MHALSFSTTSLDERAIRTLEANLSGRVIRPSDAEYDTVREVRDPTYDARRPKLVVRPADAGDVARTVTFARDHDLSISVRSGGHSMAGFGASDGGIVIDLRDMKGLHIDPERRLAWAQSGLTAGEYTRAAAAHGLATSFGDVSTVGLGGLTTGGGIGWLVRKHGLTIDSLVSAEVVTADGSIVIASVDKHPDLFWAIRGGGGNVGIVTRFQFRLQPVELVVGGALMLPLTAENLASVLRIGDEAPDELTLMAFVMPAPPMPAVPVEHHFKPVLGVMLVYAGDIEEGMAAVAPLRAVATPIADLVGPMPYPAMYQLTTEAEKRSTETVRSTFLSSIDDELVGRLVELYGSATSPMSMIQVRVLGGAFGRVPVDATAFAHRNARFMLTAMVIHEGDREAHAAWAQSVIDAAGPRRLGVYTNFLMAEGENRVRQAYPGSTYDRLAEVKRRYDPNNVFRMNQNVPPTPAQESAA